MNNLLPTFIFLSICNICCFGQVQKVSDFNSNFTMSQNSNFFQFDNEIFFAYPTDSLGVELSMYNGTNFTIYDLNNGLNSSYPNN